MGQPGLRPENPRLAGDARRAGEYGASGAESAPVRLIVTGKIKKEAFASFFHALGDYPFLPPYCANQASIRCQPSLADSS